MTTPPRTNTVLLLLILFLLVVLQLQNVGVITTSSYSSMEWPVFPEASSVVSRSTSSPVNYPTLNSDVDFSILVKYPLTTIQCAYGGRFPFYFQQTPGMVEWLCDNRSEKRVTLVMLYVFYKASSGNKGLMVDVGANCGYYSFLAARLGHQSVQFDLQPECHKILRNTVIANGYTNKVWTVAAGVSNIHANVTVPDEGCDGGFPVTAQVQGLTSSFTTVMPVHPLNHFLDPNETDILMLKVDTEGNEQRVLAGAMQFFQNRKIKNAIVEVTPGHDFWKNQGIHPTDVVQVFQEIASFGYWMVSLHDSTIHRTPQEVAQYIADPPYTQADMWLTMDEEILRISDDTSKLDPKMFKLTLDKEDGEKESTRQEGDE